ncbi:proprotein convertase subtilisin/kexin type 4 [Falco biarmicus]|uniref:proprotein convertase subtilisin/kexin type 4 n=1 Tax=Falco rusticolus TaxID=120794 RepID=UPI0018868BDE|nr:proprotein convertase subtilisin/kexin type 4 [Falco rusticolus]XP_055562668.1 proprotein convertase subtilisin/kexin type 4 [Falco cherrug]XP_056191055.1 proprotein convertase subtilisin/kexin type 4 [Falco biarmicus]
MAAWSRPALGLVLVVLVMMVVTAALPGPTKPHIYLSSWAVRVAAGPRKARDLARRLGLLCLGQVMEGEPYYHFKHRGTRQRALSRHWGWNMRLTKEPKVLWFEQQTVKRRTKRSISVVPTDPLFHQQWYMNNDIDPDLNILSAWSKGYTGLGVVLTILDDGIEKDHPDLSANYDPLASYDFNNNDPDPQPRYTTMDENWHGTRCAGEVAAVANNQICGAGVAYNAKVGGVRMLDGLITDMVEAQSLSLHPQHIHIYSASWGPMDDGKTVDGPGVLAAKAFYRGVKKGRGGLGSIFIWASGNGGINYDNCNCDGYANSIYTLSVGSVLAGGQRPWYSEGCAAILTTTYSSRTTSEVQIVTTDLHHRCTNKHTGTSASAPLAAGVIALALEANPALTWRDLQHLVVRTSKPTHLQAEDWAVNGAGRKVSHYYGYGLLDAGLLVEMAKAWTGTQPQQKCSVKALHAPQTIGSKLTVSTDVSFCSGRTKCIRSLEHVQVQLCLSYSRRGDLVIALTSPMGTTSTLVTVRPYDTSQQGYKDWTFMSTHFWDENPNGTWVLQLENKGDAYNTGLLTSFILHLHGTDEDMVARRFAASAVDKCIRRDAQGACEECNGSSYAYQRSCLPYCPPRSYSRTWRASATAMARVCASCHPSCYTCQGASANNCTACPSSCTFDELTHSCSPPQGFPSEERLQGGRLPVFICGSLILSAGLYVTYRVAFCCVKGSACCPRVGRSV